MSRSTMAENVWSTTAVEESMASAVRTVSSVPLGSISNRRLLVFMPERLLPVVPTALSRRAVCVNSIASTWFAL
jgi:hypothetical protein